MEELAKEPIEQNGVEVIEDKMVKKKGKSAIVPRHIATDEMCTFLVVNISSLQLIPVNIIAYRSQYGSANPASIVLPAIIATTISTGVGVLWCKIMCKKKKQPKC